MVKALSFKGDPKPKKRKRTHPSPPPSSALTPIHPSEPEDTTQDEGDWHPASNTSEPTGPVLLVFANSTPLSCLASDANGTVYASEIENLIEGNASSAEPSDVRQVWVASRVAGSELVGFKSASGRWLSCDGGGSVSALGEARGVEEGFGLVLASEAGRDEGEDKGATDGNEDDDEGAKTPYTNGSGVPTFHLQTSKGTTILLAPSPIPGKPPSIRAKYLSPPISTTDSKDATSADPPPPKSASEQTSISKAEKSAQAELLIKMQAKFKPKMTEERTQKIYEKIGRAQIEREAGRTLNDDEVKRLKKARKRGTYHEEMLDVRAKGKHDKFA